MQLQHDSMQESLAMLKILAISSREIREGKIRDADEVFADLEEKLLSKYRTGTKRFVRIGILSISILALSATALFAQVLQLGLRKPVDLSVSTNAATGPDSDKALVQKRWDAILQAAPQKETNKDNSAPQKTANSPDAQ